MTPEQIQKCAEECVRAFNPNPGATNQERWIAAVISRHLAAAKEADEWPKTNLGKLLNALVQSVATIEPSAFKSIHVTTAIDDADAIADRLERDGGE